MQRYKIILVLCLGFFFLTSSTVTAQNKQQVSMLKKINKLRAEGCNCSGSFMAPVGPLDWSKVLMTSAYRHAKDMNRNNYFSHYSLDGRDIGDRLDAAGYSWSYCGENLGSGQTTFDEVMKDWKKSQSHCKMMMSPKVSEVAIAKEGKYWVQHFGEKYKNKDLQVKE